MTNNGKINDNGPPAGNNGALLVADLRLLMYAASQSQQPYDVTTVCPHEIMKGENRLSCEVKSKSFIDKCSASGARMEVQLVTGRNERSFCTSEFPPNSCFHSSSSPAACRCVSATGTPGAETYTFEINIRYNVSTMGRKVRCVVECPMGSLSVSPACWFYVGKLESREENTCLRLFFSFLCFVGACAILYGGIRLAGYGFSGFDPRGLVAIVRTQAALAFTERDHQLDVVMPPAGLNYFLIQELSDAFSSGRGVSGSYKWAQKAQRASMTNQFDLLEVQVMLHENSALAMENNILKKMLAKFSPELVHLPELGIIIDGSTTDPESLDPTSEVEVFVERFEETVVSRKESSTLQTN